MEYAEFLERANRLFEEDKYRIVTNASLPDNSPVDMVASKTCFSWKGLIVLSQHFLIQYMDHPSLQDQKALFEQGFKLGKKINKVPLLRGVQFGYMILPVIVTKHVEAALLASVTQRPPKHWALFEFPVIVDLEQNQMHYFKETAAWGAIFFSDMRDAVSKYIGTVLNSS